MLMLEKEEAERLTGRQAVKRILALAALPILPIALLIGLSWLGLLR